MTIEVTSDNLAFFQCFSSATKLKIIELIKEGPRNISELAALLDVSTTIITRNIGELERSGLLQCDMVPGKRGQQKLCSLAVTNIILDFSLQREEENPSTSLPIPIGQFSNFDVQPTCGLASSDKYIGMVDDPRYFSSPERQNSGIVWFQSGYVEYTFPSYLFDKSQDISSLTISLEIGSEYPGYNNEYPSDIYFELNDITLGKWTSPGNFGDKKGFYTPNWFKCGTEYGLLKTLMINHRGSYIDGQRISNITLSDLNLNRAHSQRFKIYSPKDTKHPGGVTLFGQGFGNYDQGIVVTINH